MYKRQKIISASCIDSQGCREKVGLKGAQLNISLQQVNNGKSRPFFCLYLAQNIFQDKKNLEAERLEKFSAAAGRRSVKTPENCYPQEEPSAPATAPGNVKSSKVAKASGLRTSFRRELSDELHTLSNLERNRATSGSKSRDHYWTVKKSISHHEVINLLTDNSLIFLMTFSLFMQSNSSSIPRPPIPVQSSALPNLAMTVLLLLWLLEQLGRFPATLALALAPEAADQQILWPMYSLCSMTTPGTWCQIKPPSNP